jgi:hypothetical protein
LQVPHLRHDGHWIDDAWRRALPPLPARRHLHRAAEQGREAGGHMSISITQLCSNRKEAHHSSKQTCAQPQAPILSKLPAGWLVSPPAEPPLGC